MLLGISIEEEEVVKIEEENGPIMSPQLGSKCLESSQVCTKTGTGAKEIFSGYRKESCSKDIHKISVSKSAKKPFKIQ